MAMEMAQMKQMIDLMQQAATAAGAGQGQGSGGNSPDWGEGKGFGKGGYQSLMDEKHFRRVDKFEGNPAKFKSWMFDLLTACEYVDPSLARDLKLQTKERPKINIEEGEFKIEEARGVHDNYTFGNQKKYKGALYALIVGLTTGEAKCVVRSISEKAWESDGFLALATLQARYDANTAASLLQCVMEVVSPPTIKNHQG